MMTCVLGHIFDYKFGGDSASFIIETPQRLSVSHSAVWHMDEKKEKEKNLQFLL